MQVARLKRRPQHFYNFTGLRVEQFERLCEGVERERARQRQEKGQRRAPGGGRKAKLALETQVLVMLMYYRLCVTQMLLGYLFDTVRPLGRG